MLVWQNEKPKYILSTQQILNVHHVPTTVRWQICHRLYIYMMNVERESSASIAFSEVFTYLITLINWCRYNEFVHRLRTTLLFWFFNWYITKKQLLIKNINYLRHVLSFVAYFNFLLNGQQKLFIWKESIFRICAMKHIYFT